MIVCVCVCVCVFRSWSLFNLRRGNGGDRDPRRWGKKKGS